MARGRMLSRDISLDEKVDALSDDTARLLFTWLIPHLDREGRMYGDALLFKSIVAPRRNYSTKRVEKYLLEMENLGLIERYFAENSEKNQSNFSKNVCDFGKNRKTFNQKASSNQYLCAPNFEKHQIGLRKDKEARSKIPSKVADLGRNKDGVKPDKVSPKRKEIKVKEKLNTSEYFNIFWRAYPKKVAKQKAQTALDAVLKEAIKQGLETVDQLMARILSSLERMSKSSDWLKDGGQFIPHAATWIQGKRWEDEIIVRGQGGAYRGNLEKRRLPGTYRSPEEIFGDKGG